MTTPDGREATDDTAEDYPTPKDGDALEEVLPEAGTGGQLAGNAAADDADD